MSPSQSPAPSAAELRARDIAERITGQCICIDAYKGRGLIAPDCAWHNFAEDIVAALLSEHDRLTAEVARLCGALSEIARLRLATDEGTLRERADRMWAIAEEARAALEEPPPRLPLGAGMSESALPAARRLLGPKGFQQSEDEWRHDAETVARALLSGHAPSAEPAPSEAEGLRAGRLTAEVARLREALAAAVNRMETIHPSILYEDVIAQGREALGRE